MIGLVAGAALGLLLAQVSPEAAGHVANVVRPIGKLWLERTS